MSATDVSAKRRVSALPHQHRRSIEYHRKRFPRVLLVMGDAKARFSCLLDLTTRGFVVEDCGDTRAACAMWKYPGCHDAILIDYDLNDDLTGVFLAQEIRKREKHAQFSAQREKRECLLRIIEMRGGEASQSEMEAAVAETSCPIFGLWSTEQNHTEMVRCGCFDEYFRLPLECHSEALQRMLVASEKMPQLTKPVSPVELLDLLGKMHLAGLSESEGDALVGGRGMRGGTTSLGAATKMSAIQLEAALNQVNAELAATADALKESMHETDTANQNARLLRAELEQMTDDRDALQKNVKALESLLAQRNEDVAILRREVDHLFNSGKGPASQQPPDSDTNRLLEDNLHLRDLYFQAATEIHLLKAESSVLQSRCSRLKQKLADAHNKYFQDASAPPLQTSSGSVSILSTSGFDKASSPTIDQQVLVSSPPGGISRGARRWRDSISAVRKSLRISKMLQMKRANPDCLAQYERQMMELHDVLSHHAMHDNFFVVGLRGSDESISAREASDAVKREWRDTEHTIMELEHAAAHCLGFGVVELIGTQQDQEGQMVGKTLGPSFAVPTFRAELQAKFPQCTAEELKSLENLCAGLYSPVKSFMEESIRSYRSVIVDATVNLMKMFCKEAGLLKQMEREAAAKKKTANRRAYRSTVLLEGVGLLRAPAPPSTGAPQEDFLALSYSAGSKLPMSATSSQNAGETSFSVPAQHVVTHLSQHFHYLLRAALKEALKTHVRQMQRFNAVTAKGIDELSQCLTPMYQRIHDAETTGVLKPTAEEPTQTDPLAFELIAEAVYKNHNFRFLEEFGGPRQSFQAAHRKSTAPDGSELGALSMQMGGHFERRSGNMQINEAFAGFGSFRRDK